jgi:catecholate siderophore receptor
LTLANAGVALVAPEEGHSFELGTKWELLGNNLLLNAALFRTEKTNARETDPVDATITVLSGEQRVDGFEVGAVGRITDRWNLIAGYTWMDSEILESVNPALVGNELANTPENTVSLWSTWQATVALEFGAGAQYVDERYSATNNLRSADDYMLFNAMVAYAMNETVTLRFNGTNLADEDYAGNVGGGHYIPGDGRSLIFSVDFGF